MRLVKIGSGLLFDHDCTTMPPEVYYSGAGMVIDGNIKLLAKTKLELTALEHTDEFVLTVQNTYNPDSGELFGGIEVLVNDETAIRLEEYYDPIEGIDSTYPFIRLVRKGAHFSGYWSNDGITWNLVGSGYVNGRYPKIMIYSEGGELIVNRIYATKGMSAIVDKVPSDLQLTVDGGDPLPHVYGRLPLPPQEPLSGKEITVAGTGVLPYTGEVCGGDVFELGVEPVIEFYRDAVLTELLAGSSTDIGRLSSLGEAIGVHRRLKMRASNPFDFGFTDVILAISNSESFVNGVGYVEISIDADPISVDQFHPTLSLGEIPAQEYKEFWLLLRKSPESGESTRDVSFVLSVDSVV